MAVVLSRGDDEVTREVVEALECHGWWVDLQRELVDGAPDGRAEQGPVDGVVYVPGLLTGSPEGHPRPVTSSP